MDGLLPILLAGIGLAGLAFALCRAAARAERADELPMNAARVFLVDEHGDKVKIVELNRSDS